MQLARENPDVEIVVRRLRRGKAAVLRGHYGGSFVRRGGERGAGGEMEKQKTRGDVLMSGRSQWAG